MSKFNNSRVLITGGASGIGKIMGRKALERGAAELIIWDINKESLAAVAEEFKDLGRVVTCQIDITKFAEVERAYNEMIADDNAATPDILINCAGIVTGNRLFHEQSRREIDKTMEVNAMAPMYIAHLCLPSMVARRSGHICNIASAAGLVSNPRMSVYAASKWAVVGWSDSVRVEMKEEQTGVHITTVAPYYISTGMFDGVRSRILPILKPEKTAEKIIRAIERNNDFLTMPLGYHFIRFWQGVLPTPVFDFIFGKIFGIYSTMDNFTGRNGKKE